MSRPQLREFALKIAPRWLQTGPGASVLYTIGAVLDAGIDGTWEGIQARMPLEADVSALSAIGADRRIVRGFDETDDAYRLRLAAHLEAWRYAGHARAVFGAVQGYLSGYDVPMRIVTNAGFWYHVDAAGTLTWERQLGTWDWDGTPAAWWRFWLIIYPPADLWVAEDDWGAGEWGDGGTWGTTATPEQVAAIRGLVKTWKAAHSKCEWIVIAFDGASFDPSAPEPDGLWGPWGKGDPRVPSRLSTARYWDGVS